MEPEDFCPRPGELTHALHDLPLDAYKRDELYQLAALFEAMAERVNGELERRASAAT